MYFLAVIMPPLAVLMAGKPVQALLNILLCFCGIVPGWIHAFLVVADCKAEKRTDRLVRGVAQSNQLTANQLRH